MSWVEMCCSIVKQLNIWNMPMVAQLESPSQIITCEEEKMYSQRQHQRQRHKRTQLFQSRSSINKEEPNRYSRSIRANHSSLHVHE
jgi:hypothetical protein